MGSGGSNEVLIPLFILFGLYAKIFKTYQREAIEDAMFF
jgi:hypothetical protein